MIKEECDKIAAWYNKEDDERRREMDTLCKDPQWQTDEWYRRKVWMMDDEWRERLADIMQRYVTAYHAFAQDGGFIQMMHITPASYVEAIAALRATRTPASSESEDAQASGRRSRYAEKATQSTHRRRGRKTPASRSKLPARPA
jgi:hypothetical protein